MRTKQNSLVSECTKLYMTKTGTANHPEHVFPMVRHGVGSIMPWNCFSDGGKNRPAKVILRFDVPVLAKLN